MVGEIVPFLYGLCKRKSELNIRRFIAAPKGGHKRFPVCFIRVLDIVKGFAQRAFNRLSMRWIWLLVQTGSVSAVLFHKLALLVLLSFVGVLMLYFALYSPSISLSSLIPIVLLSGRSSRSACLISSTPLLRLSVTAVSYTHLFFYNLTACLQAVSVFYS